MSIVQISKDDFFRYGALANPRLFRKHTGKGWQYFADGDPTIKRSHGPLIAFQAGGYNFWTDGKMWNVTPHTDTKPPYLGYASADAIAGLKGIKLQEGA